MTGEITIVVTDAAPLITLAAANSLDYLLYSGLPLLIPDAVFHEATASAGRLGASEIIAWYHANRAMIRVEPTDVFQRAMKLLEVDGGRFPRDVGERAALEVIRLQPLPEGSKALLLCDDRDAERLFIADQERIVFVTTWDYLRELEAAQRIQSADAVMAFAREAGRQPARRSLWERHAPEIREAVRDILRPRGLDQV